jgi:predicted DNA-binding protein (MmcQ/YjbR family)
MTALEKAQKNMKKYYNAKHKDAPVFKVGDKVYIKAKEIKTDQPTKKFDDKQLSPYEILEKIRASSYKL